MKNHRSILFYKVILLEMILKELIGNGNNLK